MKYFTFIILVFSVISSSTLANEKKPATTPSSVKSDTALKSRSDRGKPKPLEDSRLDWKIRKEVMIEGEEILLSHVIETKPESDLPEIVVAKVPSVGKPIHLHQSKIYKLVEEQLPGLLKPKGDGPLWSMVSRKFRLLEQEEFLQMLGESTAQVFEEYEGALDISLSRKWKPIQVPYGQLFLEVDPSDKINPSSYGVIRFSLISDSAKMGPYFVQVRCQKMEKVLVTRGDIKRGNTIIDVDHVWREMDTLSMRNPFTVDMYDPSDPVLAMRTLKSGTALTLRDIKRRPLVARRSLVTAHSSRGSLTISVKALSEEEGYKGDVIKVKNIRSNKEFFARVIGTNLVEPLY